VYGFEQEVEHPGVANSDAQMSVGDKRREAETGGADANMAHE
jgi:hypothetical protein